MTGKLFSAYPMDGFTVTEIAAKFSEHMGADVELTQVTDPSLVAGVQARGYRVVALEEAMRDPAYARGAEGYDGRAGPSWLHRWAIGEGKGREFFAGEPETPAWVLALAGVEAE